MEGKGLVILLLTFFICDSLLTAGNTNVLTAPSAAADVMSVDLQQKHNRAVADLLLCMSLQQHDLFALHQHNTHSAITTAVAMAKSVLHALTLYLLT